MTDLQTTAAELLAAARTDPHGRSAQLVVHDGELRQTVLALVAGARLGEHSSPPAASLQALSGRVRVEVGDEVQQEVAAGELWELTHERHAVVALEDSVVLLTTVTGVATRPHG
ncbi:cupin [Cellulomonas wangsupingiae]|uniref:Cupin n=1 Tax=Cellulomonas wangsupingiae TaxID=2968085 RepID=A0ABY5K8Q1_9CELL|nr:cupin [Cellulomonas wangsupingiae]MCC2333128.1 cupin [Cellulomonas wangsupingiae]MCM0641307.1 cupin [Cellulomonas wangsupingiae]UUI66844.1 cupin [Cellulomonas wangsupingiae]